MKKQVANICVSLALCTTYAIQPLQMLQVHANEINRIAALQQYATGNWTDIQQGTGHIEGDATAVEQLKHIDDMTFHLTFKMPANASGVNSLFFIGDKSQAANYITIYALPGAGTTDKIGIESRANGSYVLNKNFTAGIDINDDKEHKLTFTISKGKYYKFYLDGELVKEEVTDKGFSSDVEFTPDYLGFGLGNRSAGQNNYPFSGSMKDIELYDQAISEEQILVYHHGEQMTSAYEYTNAYYANENASYVQVEDKNVAALKTLHNGSISVRYRAASKDSGVMSLFSLSDYNQERGYFNLYINPSSNTVGVELPGTNQSKMECNDSIMSKAGANIHDTNWHTVTITKADESANDRYYFYMDGLEIGYFSNRANFLDNIDTATTIGIGNVKRSAGSMMKFTGAVDLVKVYPEVLSSEEVVKEHDQILYHPKQVSDMSNAIKTNPQSLFYSGYDNSSAYRIPSLLKTKKGTILAAADQRHSGAGDAGNIDTIVRRKEAGASSFAEPIKVIDLVDNELGTPCAFNIDASMLQDDETGRIFLLVDMFPESSGLMNADIINKGTGYKEIAGKQYQMLFGDHGEEYTIREKGIVYDAAGAQTDYQVITECEAPYQELGNVYKKGEYVGNMYLYSGSNKGELHVLRAQYLWMTYSDDDGKTWSLPKDLTPQVKTDWMKFIGTGPGVGLQLANGNLTFPVYTANSNVGGSQSSAMIISKDHGETWELGDSPVSLEGEDRAVMNNSSKMLTESQAVQLNNGDIKLFMRTYYTGTVKVATSKDGGKTWSSLEALPDVYDSYCQLSITHYNKDGKEYVALVNPSASGRQNGKVYIGEVASDGSITWDYNKLLMAGHFQYSSIADLGLDEHGDQRFGVLYEIDDANGNIALDYTEFDENWVKAGLIDDTLSAPVVVDHKISMEGTNITIDMTFDQVVMAAGRPALTLDLNSHTYSADYVSGSGTRTLTFTGNISDMEKGILKVTGVTETKGILENIQNDKVTFSPFMVKDLSEVKAINASATTEHSSSTAPNTDGAAINVIDGDSSTYWHSKWGQEDTIHLPQSITIELAQTETLYSYSYTPRQSSASGRVQDFDLYVAEEKDGPYTKVYSGTFANTAQEQTVQFLPIKAKFVKMTVNTAYQTVIGSTSVAEMKVSAYQEGMFGTVDKDALHDNINTAKQMIAQSDRYSMASIQVLEAAIASADKVAAGEASEVLVDDWIAKLQTAINGLVDVTAVKENLAAARALEENRYTAESWAVFVEALDEITETYPTSLSKKELQDANMKLQYAMRQLVAKTVDKQALRTLYESLNDQEDLGYTTESWEEFQNALLQAKTMLDNDNATQQEFDQAKDTLQAAFENLKEDVSKERAALKDMIATYSDIDLSKYKEGVDAFKAALQAANAVYADETATRNALTEATASLKAAYDHLKLIDTEDTTMIKRVLKSAIDKAEALIASDDFKTLAPNVQAMINVRLNEATAVYNDDKASIETCKTAWLNLADALHYAGFKADKKMLKALIDECEAINTDKYTEASVKAFKDALADANDVYADKNALQERIDTTYSALSTAKDGLTEQPTETVDKSILLDLINTAKGKVAEADKYVKNADWEAFVDALAKAEKVYANENATQEEVNKAAAALSNAYMNIRLIPSEEMLKQLEDFINYTKKINRALYSAKDLKVIDDAANKAQEMFNKKEFSEDEFDAFTITMGNVMDVIDNNKIEKPADKDQNKNDGKQNGVKAPDTSDRTNIAGMSLLTLLAGFGLSVFRKRKKHE